MLSSSAARARLLPSFLFQSSTSRRTLIIPAFAAQKRCCNASVAAVPLLLQSQLCLCHRRPAPSPPSRRAYHPPQISSLRATHRRLSSSTMSPKPDVHGLFHKGTSTMTYIITDPASKETIILDSVLDYDAASGRTSNAHNEAVVEYCTAKGLDVKYILESHVHADHLTGAKFLKEKYPNAKTGIGANVAQVQKVFSGIFNYTESDLKTDGSQFDVLFNDNDTFQLGEVEGRVIYTPGHTPACVCYVLGDAVFSGDTIFMPDFGTARCDFPGGSSSDLYSSVKRLYDELSDDTRVFVGHDYQPGGRELLFETTIGEEKESNKQLTADTSGEEFAQWRSERDAQLGMPKLIIPSLQVNLRNGELPVPESNGVSYLKIPIDLLGKK